MLPLSDVLEYYVKFMSDDKMDYEDNLFGVGDEYECHIASANNLISFGGSGIPFKASFQDLFRDLSRLFNLAIRIDRSGIKPKLIIDKKDNVFSETSSVTLNNVNGMKKSVAIDNIYTNISIGSTTTQLSEGGCGSSGYAFPDSEILSHKQEDYFLTGECSFNNSLDLAVNLIIDSNVIQSLLDNEDKFDLESIVLVRTNSGANTQSDVFGGGTQIFNEDLTNKFVIERYTKDIPQQIKTQLITDAIGFSVSRGTDTTINSSTPTIQTEAPAVFGVVDSDPDAAFNTTDDYYTAPDDGVFPFIANIVVNVNQTSLPGVITDFNVKVKFVHAANVSNWASPISQQEYVRVIDGGDSTNNFSGEYGQDITFTSATAIYMKSGEVVRLEYEIEPVFVTSGIDYTVTILSESDWGTLPIAFDFDNFEDVRLFNYDFQYPVNDSVFNSINNNPTHKIIFNGNAENEGWIREFEHDPNRGMGTFKLISKS